MSAEYTEFAASRSPAWSSRYRRALVEMLLFCIAVPTLTVLQSSAQSAANSGTQETADVRRPQARSAQERDDFNAAYALTGAAAAEKAANDFAVKYPASELRRYLYSSAMLQYQRENNPNKMLAMGERVLELDPDNPLALVLTATAMADSLTDRDRDRQTKIAAIKRNATRAIQAAETGYPGNTGTAPLYKTTLQAMAYSALGIMKLKTGDDAGAEKELKMAADLAKIRPDAYIWYHLALAQDHRRKYTAALGSIEQALQLASSDPELQQLAEVEFERLSGLARRTGSQSPGEPQ